MQSVTSGDLCDFSSGELQDLPPATGGGGPRSSSSQLLRAAGERAQQSLPGAAEEILSSRPPQASGAAGGGSTLHLPADTEAGAPYSSSPPRAVGDPRSYRRQGYRAAPSCCRQLLSPAQLPPSSGGVRICRSPFCPRYF